MPVRPLGELAPHFGNHYLKWGKVLARCYKSSWKYYADKTPWATSNKNDFNCFISLDSIKQTLTSLAKRFLYSLRWCGVTKTHSVFQVQTPADE